MNFNLPGILDRIAFKWLTRNSKIDSDFKPVRLHKDEYILTGAEALELMEWNHAMDVLDEQDRDLRGSTSNTLSMRIGVN